MIHGTLTPHLEASLPWVLIKIDPIILNFRTIPQFSVCLNLFPLLGHLSAFENRFQDCLRMELELGILRLFFFLGPHPQHMEVSRLWVKLELQLLAYTTATATWDP